MQDTNFKSIIDLLKAFPDEQSCIDHLERLRWNGVVVSPFDSTSTVYKCKNNKYRCRNTGKYFNVRTGTIFDNTKVPLQKWFMALYIFSSHKKGISSHQLAKDISVTQKTAWFLLHRLRYAFDHPSFKTMLGNEVEVDETYMGGDMKNKHNSKKEPNTQGRSTKVKTAILGMIERNGNVIAHKVDDVSGETLKPIINKTVIAGSTIISDEWGAYNGLGKSYNHLRVNHGAKEYVNMMAYTNSIECFWSHLKRGVDGIYHWISKDHLQSYINEFSLRYNTRKVTTNQRFDVILCNMSRRLTYQTLISHE